MRRKRYERWSATADHDHCQCCWAEFDADPECDALRGGCAVAAHTVNDNPFPDDYRWICPTCFAGFRERFGWVVEPALPEP